MRLITLTRAAGLALVILAGRGSGHPLLAQSRSAEDVRIIEGYRLSMPELRKVLPALYAPGNEQCKNPEVRNPNHLDIAEMTHLLERCAPVAQALERAGVEMRDAAIIYAALIRAGERAAIAGGPAKLPPGVLRDNALLLEQHDAELRQIWKAGGQS